MNVNQRVIELLPQMKAFAHEYHALTRKPLGVTAEIGEVEASRLLDLDLRDARELGHDALRHTPYGDVRLEIKTRCFDESDERGQRTGTIDLKKKWDAVLMVLLRPDFEPREIWEVDRASITKLLNNAKRMDPKVQALKRIGKLVWPVPSTNN